jgi:hypothetical protein
VPMKLRIKATNVKICVVINSKQPNVPLQASGADDARKTK